MDSQQQAVTIIVYRGIGLRAPESRFNSKSAKWRVVFCLGREKKMSPVDVASANGNPIWDTTATMHIPDRYDNKRHSPNKLELQIRILCRSRPVGQVTLSLTSLPDQSVAATAPEQVAELEPLRRGDACPSGAVYLKCWLHNYGFPSHPLRSISSPQLNVAGRLDFGGGGVGPLMKSLRRRICRRKQQGSVSKPPMPPMYSMGELPLPEASMAKEEGNEPAIEVRCRQLSQGLVNLRRGSCHRQPVESSVALDRRVENGVLDRDGPFDLQPRWSISQYSQGHRRNLPTSSLADLPSAVIHGDDTDDTITIAAATTAEVATPLQPRHCSDEMTKPPKKWLSIISLASGSGTVRGNKRRERESKLLQQKQLQEDQLQLQQFQMAQQRQSNQLLESQLQSVIEENQRLSGRLQDALARLRLAKAAALEAESRAEELQVAYESRIHELTNFIDRMQARIIDSGDLALLDKSLGMRTSRQQ